MENNNNDEKRFAENREIIIMRDFFAPKAREKIRFTAFSGPQNVFYTSIARAARKFWDFRTSKCGLLRRFCFKNSRFLEGEGGVGKIFIRIFEICRILDNNNTEKLRFGHLGP